MLSVDFLVCSASCLIWSATTAKPLPASPALAASIDAFSASRLVWFEISRIISVIFRTSSVFFPRFSIELTTLLFVSAIVSECLLSSFIVERLSLITSIEAIAFSAAFSVLSATSSIASCIFCVITV